MRRASMSGIVAQVWYFLEKRLWSGYTVQSGSEERQREGHSHLIVMLQEICVSMLISSVVIVSQRRRTAHLSQVVYFWLRMKLPTLYTRNLGFVRA
jgi:hypothetical protein